MERLNENRLQEMDQADTPSALELEEIDPWEQFYEAIKQAVERE